MASTLGEAVVAIGADTSKFESQTKSAVDKTLSNSAKSMQNVGKSMTSVGKDLTAKVTLPLAAIAAYSIKTAADFETSMNTLQVASGASGRQMNSLSKLAIKLGADTVFSAGEAADAMLELAKGGFTPAEIAGGGVQAVMALAATEGLQLADAATIAGNAMNAFGLEASSAGQIADALAGGANASSASVRSLAEGLGNVSAMAVNMGFSLQDTVGVLAALDQAGIKGAEGGTALKSFLTSLVPATKQAKDAMDAYGLSFVNADGSMKSIGNIAGQLQKTFGKMGEAERAAALQTIFGSYAKNAAAIIMKNGTKGINGYIDATKKQGTAEEMANARMKGTAGAIERMKGSLETAALVIGQTLAPMMNKFAGVIDMLASKFSTLSPATRTIIIVIAGVAAAIGPLLIIAGTLVAAIGAIAGAFAGVSVAVAAPIAAIVLVVAAIALLLAKSQAARNVVTGAFNEIKGAVAPAIASIGAMINGQLIPAFTKMWPIIEKVGVIVLKVFAGAVVGAIKGAINVIKGIVTVITGVVQVISGILTGDWAQVWSGLKNIVMGALQAVIGAIQVWFNIGILRLFKVGFTLLTGAIRAGWALIRGLWTSSVGALRSITTRIINFLLAPFRLAFNGARAVVRAGWQAIRSIFTAYIQTIRTVVTVGFRVLRSVVQVTMNAVRQVVTSVWNTIRSAVSRSVSAVRNAVSNAFSALRGIVSGAMSAVRNAVSSGLARVVGLMRSLGGRLAGALSSAVGALRGMGVNIVQGLIGGISSMAGSVTSALLNLLPGPLRKFAGKLGISSPSKVFFRFGKWTTQGFTNGIQAGAKGVNDAMTKLASELTKNGEKGAAKIAKGFAARLAPMGKALDSVRKRLDAAMENYKAKLDEMNQYAASVSGNVVSSVFGSSGDEVPRSFSQILGDLKKQRSEAQAFAAVLTKLKNLGLNKVSYDQIASAGPDALAAAQAIVNAGKAGVNQVNAVQAGINSAAATAGRVASDYMYGAGVRTAAGVVAGLKSREKQLENAMTRLGNQLGRAIAKAVNNTAKGISYNPKKGKKKTPKHAAGTMSAPGGWSMVGERGRELVNLPGGARVYPAHQTERMTAPTTQETKVEVNQNFYGPTTGRDRLREMEWSLRYPTRGGN